MGFAQGIYEGSFKDIGSVAAVVLVAVGEMPATQSTMAFFFTAFETSRLHFFVVIEADEQAGRGLFAQGQGQNAVDQVTGMPAESYFLVGLPGIVGPNEALQSRNLAIAEFAVHAVAGLTFTIVGGPAHGKVGRAVVVWTFGSLLLKQQSFGGGNIQPMRPVAESQSPVLYAEFLSGRPALVGSIKSGVGELFGQACLWMVADLAELLAGLPAPGRPAPVAYIAWQAVAQVVGQ